MEIKTAVYKVLLLIMFPFYSSFGQAFLNGSFELNSADTTDDLINLNIPTFNQTVNFCTSFGSEAYLDLIHSKFFCKGPQDGNWYVGMSGGGSDAFSLELTANLVTGQRYRISFYDRFCKPWSGGMYPISRPVMVGVSLSNNSFGSTIFADTTSFPDGNWTKRNFEFLAPNNGKFITVKANGGDFSTSWTLVDNFRFETPTTIHSNTQNILGASIFPNPSNGKLNIEFDGNNVEKINIQNTLGQEVYKLINPLQKQDIDISQLAIGIYFLKAESRQAQIVFKVVKE